MTDLQEEIEALIDEVKPSPICGKPLTQGEELLWEKLCELANRMLAL